MPDRANTPEGYSRASTDPRLDFPPSPPSSAISSALTPARFRRVASCSETRTSAAFNDAFLRTEMYVCVWGWFVVIGRHLDSNSKGLENVGESLKTTLETHWNIISFLAKLVKNLVDKFSAWYVNFYISATFFIFVTHVTHF